MSTMKNMRADDYDSMNVETTPLKTKKRSSSVLAKKKNHHQDTNPEKYVVLALCCGIMAVMYFILAQPAALHRQLQAVMPSTSSDSFEMNFNMLFTVSYVPNMILPIFGGRIVDKYGEAKCLVVFCLVVLLGQCFTSVGVSSASWSLMLTGRLIFGLGAQNLIVANASLISKWFAGKEGVALGLSNVCSYAGVICTNMASPILANAFYPSFAFWTGLVLQTIAIGLGMIVLWIDHHNKKKPSDATTTTVVCSPMFSPIAFRRMTLATTNHTTTKTDEFATNISVPLSPGIITFEGDNNTHRTAKNRDAKNKLGEFKPTFWLLCASFLLVYGVVWSFTNVSSAILLERDFFLMPERDCVLDLPHQCSSGLLVPKEGNLAHNSKGQPCPIENNVAPVIPHSINMTNLTNEDAYHFDQAEYIFSNLSSSDVKCHDDFWSKACTADYCDAQAAATQKAGFYMSIPYFFVVALTYHLGLFVDATGYRTELICLGSALLVLAHGLLSNALLSPPLVPLIAQGLGYTICVAALWPSVPFTVSQDTVGTAFGIMMAVQNFGLALIPLLVAFLFKRNNQYLPMVEIFFAGGSLLAVLVGVALMTADRKTDHVLATPKPNIRYSSEKEGFVVLKKSQRTISDSNIAYMKLTVKHNDG